MKTVFITGANRGIGFETARRLLELGHHVIISGRNESDLHAALHRLQGFSGKVESILMDISQSESIEIAAQKLMTGNIKLDVLINNAAILDKSDHSLLHNPYTILENTLQTNALGTLQVIRNFLPLLRSPSRIINVSSGGGSMSEPIGGWAPAYCVSKTVLNSITRHLAHELQGKGIAVNAVCPGWVRTDMGGSGATKSVEQGAETPVWLATEAPDEWTGLFFRNKKEIKW